MERARCLLDNHRQNHEILSHSLRLPFEGPEQALTGFISVSQERKRRYKEVKHLPRSHSRAGAEGAQNPNSHHSASTRNSAPPFDALWSNPSWPLAPCKRRGSKINLQRARCHTGSSQAWLCPAAATPGPELTPR